MVDLHNGTYFLHKWHEIVSLDIASNTFPHQKGDTTNYY